MTPLRHQKGVHTEDRPCEDTVRRRAATRQGQRPRKEACLPNTFIFEFQAPELRGTKFLLLKLLNPWYFVTAAL